MQPIHVTVDLLARICHEVNKVYSASLGDYSHKPWDQTPKNIQDSVKAGVENVLLGKVTSPRESHESWLRFKEAEGWKYGLVKDLEKKEHPCFVPYDELPENQKLKDEYFFAIVQAVLNHQEPIEESQS